jgi:uncharacterized protein YeeX (DUF496 family)
MNRKLLLSLLATFLFSVSLAADTVIEEIVARVNDSIITRSDLTKEREQVQNDMRQQNIPPSDPRAKDRRRTCCAA